MALDVNWKSVTVTTSTRRKDQTVLEFKDVEGNTYRFKLWKTNIKYIRKALKQAMKFRKETV